MTDLSVLAARLSAGALIADAVSMASYTRDHSESPSPGLPLAVVRATCTADVQAAMRFAAANRIPVVPRGAGSGLSGGSTAIDGCIIVSLDRMRGICVDPVTHTATVQPGAFNAEVKAAAAERGLWYPPDPASFEFCSIGGNVATNAGGLCCVKYGVTTDYVLGLTVVLSDGNAVTVGGPRVKDVAGLSLTKLFAGSEGTLGVITEIVLRLVPRPAAAVTLVATFGVLDAAVRTVIDVTARMRPCMIELMDRVTVNAIEDVVKMDLDRECGAMLVIQVDDPAPQRTQELSDIASICRRNGASECFATDDPEDSEMFVSARRMAVTAVERKGTVLLEDAAVPLNRLGELAQGIRRIGEERRTVIALIAHAGDGNTHPMIVYDPADSTARTRAAAAFDDIMALTISLGGTITGEHGVGRLKQPWLERQIGAGAYALGLAVKKALDPLGILNPGVIFAPKDIDPVP